MLKLKYVPLAIAPVFIIQVLFFAFVAAVSAFAADPAATLSVPGKAVSGNMQLGAEIRGVCHAKGNGEVTFVLTFRALSEADAFFPLGTYEGPDGKAAPMEVHLTRAPKPVTFNFKSSAGWFGVKNDYLLSLRPTDTWTFLKQASDATAVSVSVVQGAKKMVLTFDNPGTEIAKFQAACKK